MEHTFRWFGVSDCVTLETIKQAGVTGVVTALHHIPNGEIWEIEEIQKVKNYIESYDLKWSFIESIPIHENIKLRKGDYQDRIENYKQSIRNVAQCGIKNICYNFMPVLDWTRTQLNWKLETGGTALRFDKVEMAVFEGFILKREDLSKSYSSEILDEAQIRFNQMTDSEKQNLEQTVLQGLPGTVDDLTVPVFKEMVAQYDKISHTELKSNLSYFLNEVIPVAESLKVKMAIHPDDPPLDIMGLPRIVKSEEDLEDLVNFIDSPSNGITFCTGSLGANPENDLPKMIHKFREKIHFFHLRNVKREENGSFFEDNHLEGSSDMYKIVKAALEIEKSSGNQIPMRPDHGHKILDDLNEEKAYPGYTAIGRLKGLAELRGLEMGIKKSVRI